ncbi:TPA_exp: putative C6 finger domain protein [Trichophyton benhamiae CBS 112371]|uniref:C6 finger domain protein, putative n=1 Tax=Arthroderma benhamiae (strain ATCC MYA-4681 / CBS 112371) TaxID=663331 RepID=D4B172_ARTBC|nr:C6 finger domain protein, putative [Trichophyton benhamiae CBS 112371]EFE31007.1 C6 finger domain protein, putative [Trichophyton benhamiae CBS 112371]DAA74193.1 TPA_exp: putative C6 finger domain protein [Trichophyton benhamiae CBS 112371]
MQMQPSLELQQVSKAQEIPHHTSSLVFDFHPLTLLVSRTDNNNNTHQTSPPYIPGIHQSLTPYVDLTRQDSLLLHHYTSIACHTLFHPLDQGRAYIWQSLVPQLAHIYPFVMHNILSLAAMHLASLQPHLLHKYTLLAARHQSHVIKAARARVASQQVTSQNCSAVVICSSLLLLYELAILHPSYFVSERAVSTTSTSTSAAQRVDEIVQKMLVMRHLVGLWNISMALFSQGPARCLLSTGTLDVTSPLAVEVRSSLDRVLLATTTLHVPDAYAAAIDSLWHCFKCCVLSTPPDWLRALAWPNMVPRLFMSELLERRPLALVLVAHYCALLVLHPGSWWMHGWPQPVLFALVEAVSESGHAHWRDLFAWPLKVVTSHQPECGE